MGGDGHLFEGHAKKNQDWVLKTPKIDTEGKSKQGNQHGPGEDMAKGEETAAYASYTQKNRTRALKPPKISTGEKSEQGKPAQTLGGDRHLLEGYPKTQDWGFKTPKITRGGATEQGKQHGPWEEMEKGEETAAYVKDTPKKAGLGVKNVKNCQRMGS